MIVKTALGSADFSACRSVGAQAPTASTIRIRLTVLPEGRFGDIETVESSPTAECVARALAAVVFQEFKGDPFQITRGLSFRAFHDDDGRPRYRGSLMGDHFPLHFRYRNVPVYIDEDEAPR